MDEKKAFLIVKQIRRHRIVAGMPALGNSHASCTVNRRRCLAGELEDWGKFFLKQRGEFHRDFVFLLSEFKRECAAGSNTFDLRVQAAESIFFPGEVVHGEKEIVP